MRKLMVLLMGVCVALTTAKDLGIKGARPAKISDYPSMASISSNGEFLAHGIILGKRVIMAPASSLVPSEIQVRVGSVDWASGGQVMPVKNILQTEFVSFIILDKDMTFGPTVKAVKFTDQPSSEEFTKLQVVGWGYPSIEDNIRTDSMYVQNLPVMNQDDCESENGELFDEIPEYVPLYCLAERSTYGMFDLAIVPVFKNGAVEAFAIGREEDTTSILLVHAQFVYHEMKMTLNAMQGIS